MSKIKTIKAREILASGGKPTIEVTVELESGIRGRASVAYGASAGSKEAVTLLDGDQKRYGGAGMLTAVANIEKEIAGKLVGMEVEKQREIDEIMIKLDGTENKSRLGGNAILAVSLAVARAGAAETKMELWQYIREIYQISDEIKLPSPMIVMIEGGKHADLTTDLQEYLVSAIDDRKREEQVRMEMEVYDQLKKILKEQGLSTNVGNEGAFAPSGIGSNEKPLKFLVEAIERAGYKPGVEAGLSIDAAASEFYVEEGGKYELKIEGKTMGAEELVELYAGWVEKYPIVTMEDMLSEFDWENWPKLVERFGQKTAIIADDLTVTKTALWQRAIETKSANAILIKLNQAGSLTETVDCCLLAKKFGLMTVPSHRGGGESNDTFMVDLAVAVGSRFIKVGPTRGERVEKYNRLMEIEEQLKK